jgi:hypothetical protein
MQIERTKLERPGVGLGPGMMVSRESATPKDSSVPQKGPKGKERKGDEMAV